MLAPSHPPNGKLASNSPRPLICVLLSSPPSLSLSVSLSLCLSHTHTHKHKYAHTERNAADNHKDKKTTRNLPPPADTTLSYILPHTDRTELNFTLHTPTHDKQRKTLPAFCRISPANPQTEEEEDRREYSPALNTTLTRVSIPFTKWQNILN